MQAARSIVKRLALPAVLLVLAAATVAVDIVPEALAQERRYIERRYIERPERQGLFDFLFGGGRRAEPARPPRELREREPRRQRSRPAERERERSVRSAPAQPQVEVVQKAETAKPLLVVGDFLAGGLAGALEQVYAENPNVRVVEKISGSSGFVRNDFYDWPAEIGPVLDEVKPAVVVVMIGSNDRQDMRVGGTSEPRRSEKWTTEYERRVNSMIEAVKSRNIPLVWVGMPAFRQSGASADMLALNDIYRHATEAAGGQFVDIWEGFVDESGAFVSSGPDMNGQPVRLRSGENGVNMTEAGRRKVAFYAEKPLEKILGTASGQTGIAGLPTAPEEASPPAPPARIVRTEPISLADPQMDTATELLGASFGQRVPTAGELAPAPAADASQSASGPVAAPLAEPAQPASGPVAGAPTPNAVGPAAPAPLSSEMTIGEKLSIEGIAPAPGRADDFGAPRVRSEPRASTAGGAATPRPAE